MKKVPIVIAVLVAVFIGVGGTLPPLAKVRDIGAIPSAFVVSYMLGVFSLTVLGCSAVFYGLSRRKAVA